MIGSNHRMVRSKIYFNTKKERHKLITKGYKAIEVEELRIKQKQYQHKLKNYIDENILQTRSIVILNNEISVQTRKGRDTSLHKKLLI